jgi:hypothetical protein
MNVSQTSVDALQKLGVTLPDRPTLADLKLLNPWTVTSGKNENGFYATTSVKKPDKYVYSQESEADAAAALLAKQMEAGLFSLQDTHWKLRAKERS